MTSPDISGLSLTDLQLLLDQVRQQINVVVTQQQQQQADDRASIGAAITALTTLLGPADAPPSTDSINGVLGYDAATMGENAGLALHLAFEGMKILTETTLNIANVMGTKE